MARGGAAGIVSIHLGEWVESNESGATVGELVEVTGLPKSAIARGLRDLERRGVVESTGKGVRGDPKRWRLQGSTWATPEGAVIDSDQTPSPSESNESTGAWL